MYSEYISLIQQNIDCDFKDLNFKSNNKYQGILEHVTYELGVEYLKLIKNDFPHINNDKIFEYVRLNDLYGEPIKKLFNVKDIIIECSPTSLRYIYHALIILRHIEFKKNKKIVEIGCGYGGLFLAIQYFASILKINIEHYFLIDLPEVGELIKKYLSLHKENIHIQYSIHKSADYGTDINNNELFLISNYCFTEISNEYRNNYIKNFFHRISSGFIIWQTCFGLQINETKIMNKEILLINEELPQTSPHDNKNYFVYF
jgi:hypothetical protein